MNPSGKTWISVCVSFLLLLAGALSVWHGVPAVHAVAANGLAKESARRIHPDNGATAVRNIGRDETAPKPELSDKEAVRESRRILAQASRRSEAKKKGVEASTSWKSEELSLLAVGMGIGDVDGDGNNEIVIIDPSTVYLYRFEDNKLKLVTQYSAGTLELKTVDVAKIRKQGPARIYVSAQNRGSVASFVLEYRNGTLVPVLQDFSYFLRVINYPTKGPILLGQQKASRRMYDGPIYQLADKGDDLEVQGRFGVPLKIPIFGFAIGDLEGKRKPLIVVYDKTDHLRVYEPDGKKVYTSKDYYGGSDVILRWAGPEARRDVELVQADEEIIYLRPRIMTWAMNRNSPYQVLAISHQSKTMRLLGRMKMLDEGEVVGLAWNGDAFEDKWATPKVQGMLMDFAVDTLPGLLGERLITLERKKTDWLAFLKSRSQVNAYELRSLVQGGRSQSKAE